METLTVTAAAAELGVRPETLRQAIRAELLPAAASPDDGRAYMLTRGDLERYRQRLAARPVELAAERSAAREAHIAEQIVALLREHPRTRGAIRALLRSAERERSLTTVLQKLVDDGTVIDAGRGQPLRLSPPA